MLNQEQLSLLLERLTAAQTVLIVLSAKVSFDQMAAALAWQQVLIAQGKDAQVFIPEEEAATQPEMKTLLGADQLRFQLGNQNLQISFPYQPEQVDKVSYHIDDAEQRFNLVIKPQKGQAPLNTEAVEMEYTGAAADVVFLVGVHELESLEQLYFGFEDLYQDAFVCTLHTYEPPLGALKITTSAYSGYAETVAQLARYLGWAVGADAATNLLQGIEQSTDNFRSLATTADTFETVASLMRAGARRVKRAERGTSATGAFSAVLAKPAVANAPVVAPPPVEMEVEQESKPKKASKPRKNKNSNKDANKPGSLSYQPSGFGPGGAG